MIIFGSKNTQLDAFHSQTRKCSVCGSSNSIIIHVLSSYFHIFWIPIFPFLKVGITECTHCKHTMKQAEMPEDVLREVKEAKRRSQTKLWEFSGLLLAVLVVAFLILSGY